MTDSLLANDENGAAEAANAEESQATHAARDAEAEQAAREAGKPKSRAEEREKQNFHDHLLFTNHNQNDSLACG